MQPKPSVPAMIERNVIQFIPRDLWHVCISRVFPRLYHTISTLTDSTRAGRIFFPSIYMCLLTPVAMLTSRVLKWGRIGLCDAKVMRLPPKVYWLSMCVCLWQSEFRSVRTLYTNPSLCASLDLTDSVPSVSVKIWSGIAVRYKGKWQVFLCLINLYPKGVGI
jgi:hypothetical protein